MTAQICTNATRRSSLSLYELNCLVQNRVRDAFPNTYWVCAETSDVRQNASSGHCYLELIEKDKSNGHIIAKARASIWSSTYSRLKPTFENETGRAFSSGIKVLLRVSVDLHPLYGYSLVVQEIDSSYTIGDMLRKRMEIVNRLKEEGVFDLNREQPLPLLPKRIAVISSPTAAGYEDFRMQLLQNEAGYPFFPTLFPAIMQGERTEESIISALDLIYERMERFDVVVIIRGGGASSDLNAFDSYRLAANCAQFPLPIITGIGHERDDTIIDLVAHTRMKTPTAVAEFLINCMDIVAEDLRLLQGRVVERAKVFSERNHSLIQRLSLALPASANALINKSNLSMESLQLHLRTRTKLCIRENERFLSISEQFIRMASPEYVLKRGYSLTTVNGKIVKNASSLKKGDRLTTHLAFGEVLSIVEKTNEHTK